ncbi:MAG: 2-oxoacid:acceptor oxidoreductase family protein [Candidatus Thorarchaeota archaeon]
MFKLKFYGLGGQGVVTATKILSHAVSIFEDKYAKTVPAYGHERRGAPVFSDLMFADTYISLNSFVYEPDFVIVLDASITDKGINIGMGIHQNSILVVNTRDEISLKEIKDKYGFKTIYWVNATQIALDLFGHNIPNSAMLGVIARAGIVKLDSITKSLMELFKGKNGEKNVQAAQKAFEKTRKS